MKPLLFGLFCVLVCVAISAADTSTRPTLFARKGGSLSVNAVTVSPNGKYFVTAGQDGVTIWSTEDGLEYRTFRPYEAYQVVLGASVAVASDGQTIALIEAKPGINKIHLIDAKTTRDENQITIPSEFPLWSIDSHPKEMLLAYMDLGGNVGVLSLDDGRIVFHCKLAASDSISDLALRTVKFSPNGALLATTTNDEFQLWDWTNHKRRLSFDARAFHTQNLRQPIQAPDGPQSFECKEGACKTTGATKTSTREAERYFLFTGSSFSPDGRRIAIASRDEFSVLEIPSGKRITRGDVDNLVIQPGCVFANNDIVFVAEQTLDLGVFFISEHRFNSASNMGLRSYRVVPGKNRGLLETAGGTYLVDPKTFQPLKWLLAEARPATSLSFSSTAELLWGTWFKPLTSWNLESGEALPFPAASAIGIGNTNAIAMPAVSSNGKYMAVAETVYPKEVRFFDLVTKQEGPPYPLKFKSLTPALSFSANGTLLAVAQESGEVEIIDAEKRSRIAALTANHPTVIAVQPDGGRVAVGDKSGTTIYDVSAEPRKVVSLPVTDNYSQPFGLQYSPDGRWLAVADAHGLHIYSSASDSASVTQKLTFPVHPPGCIAFSPKSDRIAFNGYAAGIEVATIDGKILFHDDTALSTCPASFSPDGRLLAVATQYGAELLSSDNGSLIGMLYLFGGEKELDWLIATPDGWFDGTPAAWKQLVWRLSDDTFDIAPVEIFFRDFYRPGLLAEIFAGRVPPAPANIADVDTRQPTVHLSSASDVTVAETSRFVHLRLSVSQAPADARHSGGSGVRDLRLFRNGTLVKGWRGDLQLGKDGAIDFNIDVPIVEGQNVFTTYAFSDSNIKSADNTLTITGDSSLQRKGIAYVIGMAADRYAATSSGGHQLDLKYAEADAIDFTEQFSKTQGALHQFAAIHVIPLLGSNATRSNLEVVLQALAGHGNAGEQQRQSLLANIETVQPEDGVFLFYAGHGVASNGHFYLIPQNYDPNLPFDSPDSNTISELELSHMLEGIAPARSFLVIDACQSGQAIASDTPAGPVNSPGLAQFAYEKGMYILAASSASEPAFETPKLGGGHGFLTFALVEEGLKTSAAAFNGAVELRPWFAYARRRVPELESADIGGRGFKVNAISLKEARQHPRVFYRREPEIQPFIVARPGSSPVPQNLNAAQ